MEKFLWEPSGKRKKESLLEDFSKYINIKSNYNFPITLTASMTRQLTDDEFKSIGQPKEWGVLPVRPLGATIRMTKDRRILIRNTAEIHNPFVMSKENLKKRSAEELSKATGGLNLPADFKLPF